MAFNRKYAFRVSGDSTAELLREFRKLAWRSRGQDHQPVIAGSLSGHVVLEVEFELATLHGFDLAVWTALGFIRAGRESVVTALREGSVVRLTKASQALREQRPAAVLPPRKAPCFQSGQFQRGIDFVTALRSTLPPSS